MKNKLFKSSVALLFLLCLASACKKGGTCSDGKKNQDEVNADCGGTCTPCPTCYDGAKNQNETDTDCGGVCSMCPTCSDGIQNQGETRVDCGGPCGKCKITFPVYGYYGRNILRNDTIILSTKSNAVYSMMADIPENCSLRLVLKNLATSGNFSFAGGSHLGWTPLSITTNSQEYYVNFPVKADLKLYFGGTSGIQIKGYENGATEATWTKELYWRSDI